MKNPKPRILQPKSTYTMDYDFAIEYANQQMEIFWHPMEINVEKDLQQVKTELTDAEMHGIITTLKLFTLYEIHVGSDYWSDVVGKIFMRPDIQRMSNAFSFFEINVHAPFYNRLNEILGLNNDDFFKGDIHFGFNITRVFSFNKQ